MKRRQRSQREVKELIDRRGDERIMKIQIAGTSNALENDGVIISQSIVEKYRKDEEDITTTISSKCVQN